MLKLRKAQVKKGETKMKCELVGCQHLGQFILAGVHVCGTHFRTFIVGEFGEKANPPWTRERALSALIVQDGLSPRQAQARIDKHFGH